MAEGDARGGGGRGVVPLGTADSDGSAPEQEGDLRTATRTMTVRRAMGPPRRWLLSPSTLPWPAGCRPGGVTLYCDGDPGAGRVRSGRAWRPPTRSAPTPPPPPTGSAESGTAHPVEDFLFTYYPFKPALLRRWHPGAGRAPGGCSRSRPRAAGGSTARWTAAPSWTPRHTSRHAAATVDFVRRLVSATHAPAGAAGLLRAARVGDGLPPDGRRRAARRLAAAARRRGHRRRRGRPADPVHALRRVPLLHPAGAVAQRCCSRPARARSRSSSRAACTPAWTSTSGR